MLALIFFRIVVSVVSVIVLLDFMLAFILFLKAVSALQPSASVVNLKSK